MNIKFSIWINNLILLVFILQNVSSFPFIRSTSLATPTHISDFRNQPRSDSRADKSDPLPVKGITKRPKRGAELYTELLAKVIGTARQRYDRVIRNLQQQQQKLFDSSRLNVTPLRKQSQIAQQDSNDDSGGLENENDQSNEFIGFNLDSEEAPTIQIENTTTDDSNNNDNNNILLEKKQKFIRFLLTLITTFSNNNNNQDDSDNSETMERLIQPIANSVNFVRILSDRFNPNGIKLNLENLFNNQVKNSRIINIPASESASSSLNPSINEDAPTIRERLAFQNAFKKYSSIFAPNNDRTKNDDRDINNIISGNGSQYNSQLPNRRSDSDIDDNESLDMDDMNFNIGNIGILALEIFGTVAGLTWGAFNHIQQMFQQQNHK